MAHPAAAFIHRKRVAPTKIHPPLPTDGIAQAYFEDLRPMVRFAEKLVQVHVVPMLSTGDQSPGNRKDHADADTKEKHPIVGVVKRLEKAWHKKFDGPKISKAASAAAAATNKHSEREIFKQIKSGLGIQLESVADKRMQKRIAEFTKANVALIQTVPEQYFDQIQQTVLDGVAAGRRADEIEDDLIERGEVAENRAKLIASDQVKKFNADLTEARHRDLGIDKYIWGRMPGAAKVPREEHIEREGNVYSYDDPPGDEDDPEEGGNPAVAIGCTCFAIPYMQPILDALDSEGEDVDED
jgi:uncharacterized protein with gpF-like domain